MSPFICDGICSFSFQNMNVFNMTLFIMILKNFQSDLLLCVLSIWVSGGWCFAGGSPEAFGCLSCLPEQTQAPLEACLAWTLLELRADCSQRSETNKHDVTLVRTKTHSFRFWNTAHNDAVSKRDLAFGRTTSLHMRC